MAVLFLTLSINMKIKNLEKEDRATLIRVKIAFNENILRWCISSRANYHSNRETVLCVAQRKNRIKICF